MKEKITFNDLDVWLKIAVITAWANAILFAIGFFIGFFGAV